MRSFLSGRLGNDPSWFPIKIWCWTLHLAVAWTVIRIAANTRPEDLLHLTCASQSQHKPELLSWRCLPIQSIDILTTTAAATTASHTCSHSVIRIPNCCWHLFLSKQLLERRACVSENNPVKSQHCKKPRKKLQTLGNFFSPSFPFYPKRKWPCLLSITTDKSDLPTS